jgi:5-methylcytosine-specific restriction enzyme A
MVYVTICVISPFMTETLYFTPADPTHIRREKAKAKDLRATQWWRNQLGLGICYYCSEKFAPTELTMDHRIAIVRGGKTTKSNVVTACKTCNSEKKYLTPFELALAKQK